MEILKNWWHLAQLAWHTDLVTSFLFFLVKSGERLEAHGCGSLLCILNNKTGAPSVSSLWTPHSFVYLTDVYLTCHWRIFYISQRQWALLSRKRSRSLRKPMTIHRLLSNLSMAELEGRYHQLGLTSALAVLRGYWVSTTTDLSISNIYCL